jgi:hypothetical protein
MVVLQHHRRRQDEFFSLMSLITPAKSHGVGAEISPDTN